MRSALADLVRILAAAAVDDVLRTEGGGPEPLRPAQHHNDVARGPRQARMFADADAGERWTRRHALTNPRRNESPVEGSAGLKGTSHGQNTPIPEEPAP